MLGLSMQLTSIEEVGEVNAVLDGDRVVPRTASAHLTWDEMVDG